MDPSAQIPQNFSSLPAGSSAPLPSSFLEAATGKSTTAPPSFSYLSAARAGLDSTPTHPLASRVSTPPLLEAPVALASPSYDDNRPLSPREGKGVRLTVDQLWRIRPSQDSIASATREGQTLKALGHSIAISGWNDKCPPITLVKMPGTDYDPVEEDALHHLVAYDNRRRSAIRRALEAGASPAVIATIHHADDPAHNEFRRLRAFTHAESSPIPEYIREHMQDAWNEWNDDTLLDEYGIIRASWGHLIKLRMAMGFNEGYLAHEYNGFQRTPVKRPLSRAMAKKVAKSAAKTSRRALGFSPPSDDSEAAPNCPAGSRTKSWRKQTRPTGKGEPSSSSSSSRRADRRANKTARRTRWF